MQYISYQRVVIDLFQIFYIPNNKCLSKFRFLALLCCKIFLTDFVSNISLFYLKRYCLSISIVKFIEDPPQKI